MEKYTWEIHKELFNALKLKSYVSYLSLIIFVAAFNLISSIMIVKIRKRYWDLRSLGFTKIETYVFLFFIGSFVGILGTIWGTILGVLVTINIARIQLFLEGY